MSAREQFVNLLTYYVQTASRTAGVGWSRDNDNEMDRLADLFGRAIDEAIEAHCENRPHFYADGAQS